MPSPSEDSDLDEDARLVDLRIAPPQAGSRLDRALADAAAAAGLEISRSRITQLIIAGAVTGPGDRAPAPAQKARSGDHYQLLLPPRPPAEPRPEAIPLSIIFEDRELIVVDKPAGMVVHPAPGAESGTLVNALLAHCGPEISQIGDPSRPGIVHRIDKDTSGLLVVAKTEAAYSGLTRQFAAQTVERVYLAFLWGAPDRADPRLGGIGGISFEAGGNIRIETGIARHRSDRKRMAVSVSGRRSVTHLHVREQFGPGPSPIACLAECRLETGRTHQIRVHASYIGHPLIGDPVYGRNRIAARTLPLELRTALLNFPRQALLAAKLGFEHPITGVKCRFLTNMPQDMTDLSLVMRRNSCDKR